MKDEHPRVRRLWNGGRWDLVCGLLGSRLVPAQVRRAVLRRMVDHIGAARICSGFFVNNRYLRIGDNVFLNDDVSIDCNAPVVIGDGVAMGPGCRLVTSGHLVGPPTMRRRGIDLGEIRIGEGVWLATGVTVLPGVTVGDGCIVAAGAVVTDDCAPHGLYAGVPARRVKDLPV